MPLSITATVTPAAVWTDQACSASRVVMAHCCVRSGSLLMVARWTARDRPTATTAGSASTRRTSALAWTRSGATSGRTVNRPLAVVATESRTGPAAGASAKVAATVAAKVAATVADRTGRGEAGAGAGAGPVAGAAAAA